MNIAKRMKAAFKDIMLYSFFIIDTIYTHDPVGDLTG